MSTKWCRFEKNGKAYYIEISGIGTLRNRVVAEE